MTRITLIEGDLPAQLIDGDVGVLLELAPDSSTYRTYPHALSLAQLIGSFDNARTDAHRLAQCLLAAEPPLRGLRQLSVFEEMVIGELQYAMHTVHLHDVLVSRGYSECVFVGPSRFARGIAVLGQLRRCGPRVVHQQPKSGMLGRLGRSFARLRNASFDMSSVRQEWRQVLETIDPFGLRHLAKSRWKRGKSWSEGEIWFYTTAYTFTNAGLLYEPYFPQPFRYFVDNPLTGGRALAERGRIGIAVDEFLRFRFIPRAAEINAARNSIVQHLKSIALCGTDALARDMFLGGDFFSETFSKRLLPKGLHLTEMLRHWVETVKPSAVVAGNTVFETYALAAARDRNIPTVVLQHGLFLDYCQFLDPPAERYFVRGRLWRDFLAPTVRPKALVLDPPQNSGQTKMTGGLRRTIVFLTQPFVMPYFHEVELDDLLTTMIDCAVEADVELCVRVHPMESLSHYRARVAALCKSLGREPREVSFSQGPGLDDVLARAAVAVTNFSTVFQDCLRHGVPVVSLDWHDFASKSLMTGNNVFVFAKSLAELRQQVLAGIAGRLPSSPCDIREFLASTPEVELRTIIESVLSGSH